MDEEPTSPEPVHGLDDEGDDDAPAPETGLHALGQLAVGVAVVAGLIAVFLGLAVVWGWIFR